MLLCPDIFSTGLSGAESGQIRVGDAVAVFAEGPIGLCATLGAKLKGASLIIGVDPVPARLATARQFGANVVLNPNETDVVAAIRKLTDGRGRGRRDRGPRPSGNVRACAAIDPAWRHALEPRRVLGQARRAVQEAIFAGLGDQKIVTTLCPGGKERMRRLMTMVENRRVDLMPLVTHRFALDDIEEAFDVFSHQREGVLKVALYPNREAARRTALVAATGVDREC